MSASLTSVSVASRLAFIRVDVDAMSRYLFGIPYITLQGRIYPKPSYKTFLITKRNGTPRVINEPRRDLKNMQMKLLAYLYEHAGPIKPCVHGFTFDRSIVTNARMHCSPKTQHLLNIDIEDFFPSITFYRVRGLLQKKPFDFSHSVATVLAQICTFHGVLPQGAPTSPFLANLVCRSLDRDLMQLAKRHRATYTRYADDITISFSTRRSDSLPANICSFDSGIVTLGDEIRSIFSTNSFRINATKSRMSTRLQRLEVTGITINEFPNVKRIFIDRIRGALHAWDKHGYGLAQARWEQVVNESTSRIYEERSWKRQRLSTVKPELKNVLWGKLLYLRMVRGGDDIIYTRLAERYNVLCAREKLKGLFVHSSLPVTKLVLTNADAENAIFVIEWTGEYMGPGNTISEMVGGQGTAFAYKDVGLITCDHVLRYSEMTKKNGFVETDVESVDVHNVSLSVLNPATGASCPVKAVHRDKDYDLAVLQFDHPKPPAHRHFTGMDARIPIHADGILIGFPNHSAGKRANFLKENVLNRSARAGLQRFDITGAGSIRKGNSGGPFVDELYRVAGVAQQGATQDRGNDECLCIMELERWLANWKHASTTTAVPTIPPAHTAAPSAAPTSELTCVIGPEPIEPELALPAASKAITAKPKSSRKRQLK